MVGQRLQQHRVDHAEDRGVGADAERERQHGHGREGGMRASPRSARGAGRAPGPRARATRPGRAGRPPRTGCCRPGAWPSDRVGGRAGTPACVLGGELQVQPELLLPLGPRPPPAQRSPEAAHPFAKYICSTFKWNIADYVWMSNGRSEPRPARRAALPLARAVDTGRIGEPSPVIPRRRLTSGRLHDAVGDFVAPPLSALDARLPGELRVAADLDASGDRGDNRAAVVCGSRAPDPGWRLRVVVLDPAPTVPATARSRGSAPPAAAGANASSAGGRHRRRVRRNRSRSRPASPFPSGSVGRSLPVALRPRGAAMGMAGDIPPGCGARACDRGNSLSRVDPAAARAALGSGAGGDRHRRPLCAHPRDSRVPWRILCDGRPVWRRRAGDAIAVGIDPPACRVQNLQSFVLATAFPTALEDDVAFAQQALMVVLSVVVLGVAAFFLVGNARRVRATLRPSRTRRTGIGRSCRRPAVRGDYTAQESQEIRRFFVFSKQ